MNESALQSYLREKFPKESSACEWKEFKNLAHAVSGRKGSDIASYLSAIANIAGGHLIVGVQDTSLHIVGIQQFHDYTPENIRQRLLGRCTNLDSEGFCVESLTTSDSGKTVWIFHIPRHRPRLPIYAHDKAWQRLDDALVEMRQERLEAILNEPMDTRDWSAEKVVNATFCDLDEQALRVAREKFSEKHRNAPFAEDIPTWDLATFLDKAKLTITDDAAGLLRKRGLIEGRKPNYYAAAQVARSTGNQSDYIRNRAFNDVCYKDMVLDYLTQYGSASRFELATLILDKLSDALDEKQKQNKFRNLLHSMSTRDQSIEKSGGLHKGRWIIRRSSNLKH